MMVDWHIVGKHGGLGDFDGLVMIAFEVGFRSCPLTRISKSLMTSAEIESNNYSKIQPPPSSHFITLPPCYPVKQQPNNETDMASFPLGTWCIDKPYSRLYSK